MVQDILTITAIFAASVYALLHLVKMFLPSKNNSGGHHCGGCTTEGCGIKNLPIKNLPVNRPLPFNPNELFPF